jgi:SOS-response transcriptional repressor LexA
MKLLQKLIKDAVDEGKSLRRIAIESCVEYTSVSNYYHRDVEPRGKNLGLFSKYFKVPFYDLLDEYVQHGTAIATGSMMTAIAGTAVSLGSRTVPVISKAQAGDFGYWEDAYPVGEGSTRIECPADIIDPNAFAVQVEGDSMYPRYMQGEFVIVDTTKPVMNNDDVVVKLHDGAVMIKRYKMMREMIFLESYNPAVEPIPVLDGDMVCCFKIVCRK